MTEPLVVDAFQSIDAMLEGIANSDDDPAGRLKRLRVVERRLEDLLGKTQSYAADVRLVEEASSSAVQRRVLAMRANADAYDHLVARGHDPEDLKQQGFMTHADLDGLAEEGLLTEAAMRWPDGEPGDDEDLPG